MGKSALVKNRQNSLLLAKNPVTDFLVPIGPLGLFIAVNNDVVTHNQVGTIAQDGVKQNRCRLGMQHVITVHHDDPLPAHHVEGGIAGCRQATVGLMDDANAFITLGPTVAYGSAAIGATVIHYKDFQMAVTLAHDALHALIQIPLHIIDGHDDRYQRLTNH